jgi:CO/xanthine dehydrogenase FAD-binding subunit
VAAVLHSGKLTLGIGGAEDKPVVLKSIDPAGAAKAARDAVNPTESARVPALYRKELVEVLTRRAVARCLSSS